MSTTEPKSLRSDHLNDPLKIGDEISITGKWIPKTPGSLFRRSPDTDELLSEWENIHSDARADPNVLHTEINHAVGEDAILVHHVFRNPQAVLDYFASTASSHARDLLQVAQPQLHFVHGIDVPEAVTEALNSKGVPTAAGNFSYGFVRDYAAPDASSSIEVIANWGIKPGVASERYADLKEIWRQVGNEAFETELGMQRFEVYEIAGKNALITRETFDSTDELKFHLTKGTAAKYKSKLDEFAAPENYYFRGPVAWMIRTYSKFMHLPATYSHLGSHHTMPRGSKSSGTIL